MTNPVNLKLIVKIEESGETQRNMVGENVFVESPVGLGFSTDNGKYDI